MWRATTAMSMFVATSEADRRQPDACIAADQLVLEAQSSIVFRRGLSRLPVRRIPSKLCANSRCRGALGRDLPLISEKHSVSNAMRAKFCAQQAYPSRFAGIEGEGRNRHVPIKETVMWLVRSL